MVKFKKKSLSGSSKRWIQRHHNDDLVLKAKSLNFRSRAVFKLEEINKKIKFLNKKDNILDLGASPGSWSQFLVKKGFKNILAVDILNMHSISGVTFILGDFTDEKTQENPGSENLDQNEESLDLFDQETNEEEDFEIPAFLRRQKF